MILIEQTLGNIADAKWREIAADASVDELVLEQWESVKNRYRKFTEGGVELAVSLPRGQHVHDGDVLFYDAEKKQLYIAKVKLRDILRIDCSELKNEDSLALFQHCFELGHALGNQHWTAVIKGYVVYIPVNIDHKVMLSAMKTHAFAFTNYEIVNGADVVDELDSKQQRILFSSGEEGIHHHHHH